MYHLTGNLIGMQIIHTRRLWVHCNIKSRFSAHFYAWVITLPNFLTEIHSNWQKVAFCWTPIQDLSAQSSCKVLSDSFHVQICATPLLTLLNHDCFEQIDNTDAEGRLILADALCYACAKLQPRAVVDLATLTGTLNLVQVHLIWQHLQVS